jgi:hypothetical protein
MIGSGALSARRTTGVLAALAVAAGLSTTMPGCAFAVDHPATTAGIVAATFAFGTCKLASDDYAACGLAGAGAGAFLFGVTALALWLGGDGHSVLIEEQAQPLPDDGRPIRRRHHVPAADPAAPIPANPAAAPIPANPAAAPASAAPPATPVAASPSPAAASPSPPAPSQGAASAPPPAPPVAPSPTAPSPTASSPSAPPRPAPPAPAP